MAKQTITGGDGVSGQTGLSVRTMINDMFTELYSKFHTRKHSLTSMDDHSTVFLVDRGKYCKSDGPTGNVIWGNIEEAELPVEIARQSALTGHTGNKRNPHEVTATQLGITITEYYAGYGLATVDSLPTRTFSVSTKQYGGLYSGPTGVTISDDNSDGAQIPADLDRFMFTRNNNGNIATITVASLRASMSSNGSVIHQVIATSGKEVSVRETGEDITAEWTAVNELTITLPMSYPVLQSVAINITGYSTMVVKLAYGYHGSPPQPFWPIMQAWRDDTKNQLVGAVLNGDAGDDYKWTITGLITGTTNHINLNF